MPERIIMIYGLLNFRSPNYVVVSVQWFIFRKLDFALANEIGDNAGGGVAP